MLFFHVLNECAINRKTQLIFILYVNLGKGVFVYDSTNQQTHENALN